MAIQPFIFTVALPTPLYRHFEYLAPLGLDTGILEKIPHGVRVEVPFGQRTLVGFITGISHTAEYDASKLKPIARILDSEPLIKGDVLALCQFAAEYYQHPLGEVITAALPQVLRAADGVLPTTKTWQLTTEGKGLNAENFKRSPKQQAAWQALIDHHTLAHSTLGTYRVSHDALKALTKKNLAESVMLPSAPRDDSQHDQQVLKETPLELNTQQKVALKAVQHNTFGCYLLEGTTGSGKTEVYLHAIAQALQAGKQALILVPEIGLTPQTVSRFIARFAVPVVELHSSIAKGARLENWHAAFTGEARIIIGTRLSVFAPAPNLGIMIVDEEHDLSFKQQDGLRYNARDLAIMRAKYNNIPLILGSATPSIESLHNALNQRFHYMRITERAGSAKPPSIQLLDMRRENVHAGIGQTSLDAISATLARGEQALVFINRRGFAPALLCQSCGWSAACARCDTRMTLHNQPRKLHCHHCGSQHYPPKHCPSCLNPELTPLGQGTERAEEVLQQSFANYPVHRVDQDSMQRKNAMKELNAKLETGEPCLLVGTQMLAKGHHFPSVTLVIIVDADQGLLSGDFRGIERMGQQIVQVAGRAGRANKPGTVLIQSYRPDHPALNQLIHEGYSAFAKTLLEERQHTHMPPIQFMALIRAESKRADNAKQLLQIAMNTLCTLLPPSPTAQYIGPIPAFMEKRNDRYRYQLQLKFAHRAERGHIVAQLREQLNTDPLSKRVRWSIDIDPMDMG